MGAPANLNLPFSYDQTKILPSSFQYGIKADSSDNVVGRFYESGPNINAGHEELDFAAPLVTFNQLGLNGAGFTFVANYKFYSDLSVLSWINTKDFNPCLKLNSRAQTVSGCVQILWTNRYSHGSTKRWRTTIN